MISRMLQVGLLVALIGVGGMLYSIRKHMTPPPPPAPATTATAPIAPLTAPPEVQTPAPAPVEPEPVVTAKSAKQDPFGRHPAPRPARHETIAQKSQRQAEATVAQNTNSRPSIQPSNEPQGPATMTPDYSAPPPPPPPRQVTIPAGTSLSVRMIDAVSTARNKPGDTFNAELDQPLVIDGLMIADRGANVLGRVSQARQSGRVNGLAQMSIELVKLKTIAGEVNLRTDATSKTAENSHNRDAAEVGGGAALGAIIGGIAGGGRGAAIGAIAGGAAGGGAVMATRGKEVEYGPESQLAFSLTEPVTLTVDPTQAHAAAASSHEDASGRPSLRHRRYSQPDPNQP